MKNDTKELLRALADKYECEEFLRDDPSQFMHNAHGDLNKEATAFVASVLSFGSRSQFLSRIASIVDCAKGDVHLWIVSGAYRKKFKANDLTPFYRFYTFSDMRCFFDVYSSILNVHGSLGAYLNNKKVTTGVCAVTEICNAFLDRGGSKLIPASTASSCKRLCMFIRWMVRDDSPVDIGMWKSFIDKTTLVIPLDTHVLNQSVRLGLIKTKTSSMSNAIKLTQTLKEVFPDDPLKGDYALFGLGVNINKIDINQ